MALTGRYNFRRSMTGKLILQVEYEARGFWSWITGSNTLRRRWRNAKVMDLAAPELRTLLDLRFKPRFAPPQPAAQAQPPAQDWPLGSQRLDAIPHRPIPYLTDEDDPGRPLTH